MVEPSVLSLVDEDQAIIFEDIIKMRAQTGKHVDIIINEMARHYEVKERYITDRLKSICSKFTDETNRIVGYIDGEPIKRTTYHMSCKRIYEKLIAGVRKNDLFDPTDQEHINFLTESTYTYVKNCDRTVALEV